MAKHCFASKATSVFKRKLARCRRKLHSCWKLAVINSTMMRSKRNQVKGHIESRRLAIEELSPEFPHAVFLTLCLKILPTHITMPHVWTIVVQVANELSPCPVPTLTRIMSQPCCLKVDGMIESSA